ncbi:MAG TPA: carbonic anhydrase family protein [Aldersonia sp.]
MTVVISDPRRMKLSSVIGTISSRRRTLIVIAAAVSISPFLQACSSATTTNDAPSSAPSAASPTEPVEWSYSGDNGPDQWGEIAASCQSGTSSSQSPINIDSSSLVPESPPNAGAVTLHYVPTHFEVENTGRTIEAVPDDLDANSITIDGTRYYLQQFHLHTPSEHTITNQSFPIELHLVNKSEDGAIAVLGVLLAAGAENSALSELFTKMPTTVTDEQSMVPLDGKIDPTDLIPPSSAIARYSGSLTTPPCTEPVLWSVFMTPSTVSAGQVADLQQIFPDNHRPTQPLNGRVINEVQEG